MAKFTKDQEIKASSVCDHNCIFTALVLKRTAKTITIKNKGYAEPVRVKIYEDDNGEYIYPLGRYSMAPIMRAYR